MGSSHGTEKEIEFDIVIEPEGGEVSYEYDSEHEAEVRAVVGRMGGAGSAKGTTTATPPGPWCSLVRAAAHLDEPVESLRKKVERAGTKLRASGLDATFVNIDGVVFRKFGHVWKCSLPSEWRASP